MWRSLSEPVRVIHFTVVHCHSLSRYCSNVRQMLPKHVWDPASVWCCHIYTVAGLSAIEQRSCALDKGHVAKICNDVVRFSRLSLTHFTPVFSMVWLIGSPQARKSRSTHPNTAAVSQHEKMFLTFSKHCQLFLWLPAPLSLHLPSSTCGILSHLLTWLFRVHGELFIVHSL